MTLSITLKGYKLSQDQLDAIVPVINRRMLKSPRLSLRKFEEACVKAMAESGCPLADRARNSPKPSETSE